MNLRYPGERVVDGLWWESAKCDDVSHFARAIGGQVIFEPRATGPTAMEWKRQHRVTWREFDRETMHVAPWWIAWLYRWLPHFISWHGKQYDSAIPPFFCLWSLFAYKWSMTWLPKRRALRYGAMRLGVLRFNQRVLTL